MTEAPATAPLPDEAGAIAFLESREEPPADTPATAPPPADAPPAEAQRGAVELPGFAEVEKLAKERAAEREQQEQMLAPVRALEKRLDGLPTGPAVTVANLQNDPIEALRSAGVDLSALKASLEKADSRPDPMTAIRDLIRAELEPLKPAAATEQPQGPDLDTAQAAFGDYISAASATYPTLARMPAAYRGTLAWQYVTNMRKAGIDTSAYSDEQIARALESQMSSGTPPVPNGNPEPVPTGQTPSPGTPLAANGGSQQSAPRSITNGLAAESQRHPPRTDKEIEDDTVAWLSNHLRS